MEVIKIRDYSDYVIQYNSGYLRFEAVKDGEVRMEDTDEQRLQEKIKTALKRQEKLQTKTKFPIDAIHCTYTTPRLGKITSIAEDGSIWFTHIEKGESKRSKVSTKYGGEKFYNLSDNNNAIVKEYNELNDAIEKLSAKQNSLHNKLDSKTLINIEALINPE